jgi:hypothetical protein
MDEPTEHVRFSSGGEEAKSGVKNFYFRLLIGIVDPVSYLRYPLSLRQQTPAS